MPSHPCQDPSRSSPVPTVYVVPPWEIIIGASVIGGAWCKSPCVSPFSAAAAERVSMVHTSPFRRAFFSKKATRFLVSNHLSFCIFCALNLKVYSKLQLVCKIVSSIGRFCQGVRLCEWNGSVESDIPTVDLMDLVNIPTLPTLLLIQVAIVQIFAVSYRCSYIVEKFVATTINLASSFFSYVSNVL
jgi:hypothetical protein